MSTVIRNLISMHKLLIIFSTSPKIFHFYWIAMISNQIIKTITTGWMEVKWKLMMKILGNATSRNNNHNVKIYVKRFQLHFHSCSLCFHFFKWQQIIPSGWEIAQSADTGTDYFVSLMRWLNRIKHPLCFNKFLQVHTETGTISEHRYTWATSTLLLFMPFEIKTFILFSFTCIDLIQIWLHILRWLLWM